MTSKRILLTFLLLNIFVIFYGYVSGFGKSLWLDELMSINFARELPNLNLREIFTQDPNAPFFYIFLYLAELILKVFNIKINENINLIRAFNLIGFIPIFLSYKILKTIEKCDFAYFEVFRPFRYQNPPQSRGKEYEKPEDHII